MIGDYIQVTFAISSPKKIIKEVKSFLDFYLLMNGCSGAEITNVH
jgi:hypothetical protein